MLNQWNKTIVTKPIQAFYIKDSKGLNSPVYFIKTQKSNIFKVIFETSRVFENEVWIFDQNGIIPVGLDGHFQKYALQKNEKH